MNSQNSDAQEVEWTGIDGIKRKFKKGKHNRKLVTAKDINFSKWQSMPWPRSALFSGKSTTKQRFLFNGIHFNRNQFARFLGIYLSEGWTNGKRITISQSKYFPEMEGVLKNCGLRFSIIRNKGMKVGFEVANRPLAKYLLQFGKSADKYVPQWLKNSGWRVIEEFLHWYCLGDGSFYEQEKSSRGIIQKRYARKYFTISRNMADDLQEMLAKRGRQSLVREDSANGKPRYVVTERVVQDKNFILPNHAKWVDYDGEIFCVTVPNHILLVRRNGKIMWCGNSSYIGCMTDWDNLPEQVRDVSEQFAPALKAYDYRGFWASEIRILPDKFYFIDTTNRAPSPPHQLQTELWGNFADIIWQGANGTCIDPEPTAKFGVQALLSCHRGNKEWVSFNIPDKIKKNVKCGFCCEIGNKLVFPPHELETMCGYLVGTGDTIQEAITELQDCVKELPAGMKCEDKSIAELLKELQLAEDKGIEFTDQEIPEPSVVIDA